MHDSLRTGPIVELVPHPVLINIQCRGCVRCALAKPAYLVELGIHTLEQGERRMKCGKCGSRARLGFQLEWSVSGGRDLRRDPPPLPGWIRGKVR